MGFVVLIRTIMFKYRLALGLNESDFFSLFLLDVIVLVQIFYYSPFLPKDVMTNTNTDTHNIYRHTHLHKHTRTQTLAQTHTHTKKTTSL